MDQIKIGKFIAECRKRKNLTQAQLAEQFNISDRAVSKWERGLSMPDSSIMLELCEFLGISVNELFAGEEVEMNKYNEMAEKNLIAMKKAEEKNAKAMLRLELVIGYMSSISFLVMIFAAGFAVEELLWQVILIVAAVVIFAVGIGYALKVERDAGYYQCGKCHHKYVPEMGLFGFSWTMHFGRTRYMKCPQCGKWSWQKKVVSKD